MIAQIIPLLKLPASLDFFSYTVPLELENVISLGQIVAIDFGHKKINGLIIGLENKKPIYHFKLKKIIKIVTLLPIINAKQIELIKFIAQSTGSSLTGLAKTLVPNLPKKNLKYASTCLLARQGNQKKNIKIKNNKKKAQLLWYRDISEVENLIKEKIKLALKNKEQILILIPEISLIKKIIINCSVKEKDVAIVHSQIKKSDYFQTWQNVLNNKNKIIIGTKIAVFLPFVNLKHLIILNAESWNHKQSEANPRFDARDVAEWLAENFGAELVLTTTAPNLETYNLAVIPVKAGIQKKKFANKIKFLGSRFREDDKKGGNIGPKAVVSIVNLKNERQGGNYNPISDKLLANIKEKLNNKQKIFLFHNRIGFAKLVNCQDCEYVFKCPKCANNLAYENKKKQLVCSWCKYHEDMSPFCPKCSGININFKGAGTQKVKSELQKLLPEAKILELDKLEHKTTADYQIIIGTRFVINKIDLKEFALIAFINFDQLLNIGDFRAEEKAYQLFYNIFSAHNNADFVLQTNIPENLVIQSIKENKPEIFYNSELQTRQDFNYPPFSQLVKFIATDKKELLVKNSLKKISEFIKNIDEKIELLGPLPDTHQNKNFKFNLIAKIPLDITLDKILNNLPKNVMLDINPEKIN